MRTPQQSEITAFFQGRFSMAQEVEAAADSARRGKKSVEKAVREAVNMKTWHMRAENHGYTPETHGPRLAEVRRSIALAAAMMLAMFTIGMIIG